MVQLKISHKKYSKKREIKATIQKKLTSYSKSQKEKNIPIKKKIPSIWSIRERKIKGMVRLVKVRKHKGKTQVRILHPKKKEKRFASYWEALRNFSERKLRSRELDYQKKSKTVYPSDKIPESYLKHPDRYDVKNIDMPKEYKKPKGTRKRKALKYDVYGHAVRGFYLTSQDEIVHNTSIPQAKSIARAGKIHTSKFGKDESVSLSVDKNFSMMGNKASFVFDKKKLKNLTPVTYYNNNVYHPELLDSIPKEVPYKEEHLRIAKGVYNDGYFKEAEWLSKKEIPITKKNLKKIVYMKPSYASEEQYQYDRTELQKLAKELGVPFEERVRKEGE